MPHPTRSCPLCGSPVTGSSPSLTGAQVDAAYRMVAAVKRWVGRMSPAGTTMFPDQSDLLQAARDFEEVEQRRAVPVTHIGPDGDAHALAHEHAAKMVDWVAERRVEDDPHVPPWEERRG